MGRDILMKPKQSENLFLKRKGSLKVAKTKRNRSFVIHYKNELFSPVLLQFIALIVFETFEVV